MARGQEPRPRGADRPDPVAAAPQARRLRDRRVLPAEGAHRARAEAERARRLALVRGVGRRPGARPRDAPPHAGRQAPLRDRLPRAPVGPGAPVRRHAPPVQARHVDARPAGHVRPADARVHGRGLRLRAAHRDAAGEEADPHDPQAGPRVRRRHGARDAEPGRPRLQGDGERRHVARRPAPDRARQGPRPRGLALGGGRGRRRRARRRDRRPAEAAVPAREREELGAALFATRWAMSYLRGP